MPAEEPEEGLASSTASKCQRPLLLSLPLEILQTILWHMNVGTFVLSALVCKTIKDASLTKSLMMKHLRQLPGLRLGLDDLALPDLYACLRKRAAQNFSSCAVSANVTEYSPPVHLRRMAISALSSPNPALLATAHDYAAIQIYELRSDIIRFKYELRLCFWDADCASDLEILKLAFSPSRDVAVLYRHRTLPPSKATPFSNHRSTCEMKLCVFHRMFNQNKGYFYCSTQREIRDITCTFEDRPVGLALASDGKVCITWKCDIDGTSEVCIYGRDPKAMAAHQHDPHPAILKLQHPRSPSYIYSDATEPTLIFDARFTSNSQTVNLFAPGSAIHSWYTNACQPNASDNGPTFENRAIVEMDPGAEVWEEFSISMPFHAIHHTDTTSVPNAGPFCQFSYLAIGMSKTHDFESNVFVLQAKDATLGPCTHEINLEQGRRLATWKPLALLAGWRSKSTSSLGTVADVSPHGGRIAAGTWRKLLVWSLNPTMLQEGGLQHYFPARDYNSAKGIGRLKPIKLPCEGVIYRLIWISETILYAITDRGITRWDMGHLCKGQRERLTLTFDAWSEHAVDMRQHGAKPWYDDERDSAMEQDD